MPFTRADVLSAAQQSLAAAGAGDRAGWVELFSADGRVEDPVGSEPHRGHAAIGRFYDTFIGPRTIDHHLETDIVVGTTVIRDVELEIAMTSTLTMRIPAYIRYDLRDDKHALRVAALSAYWEMPAMVGQFARAGLSAVPAGVTLTRALFANQGLAGSLGFVSGLRGIGSGGKKLFARFLDHACAGDELGMRRLVSDAPVTIGDTDPLAFAELVRHLSGGTWSKLIGSGRAVVARVDRDGQRTVLIGEIGADDGSKTSQISRIRVFGEIT